MKDKPAPQDYVADGWLGFDSRSGRLLAGEVNHTFADRMRRTPGLVSHGVALQNPGAPREQQIWAYEVRWLRGQPAPSLPPTIDGRAVKLVVVDAYPRPQATISGESNGRGPVDFAKTVAIFALFAIPVGLLISKTQERKHLREEKAAFHRLGLDWSQRYRG